MRYLKPELIQFTRVWDVSIRFGVQERLVWELFALHRPEVINTKGISKSWRHRCLEPAELRCLIIGEDFPLAARTIIRDDAPWFVWANKAHTERYVDTDLAKAWSRTWMRCRPGVIEIEQELAETTQKISEFLTLRC